MRCNASWRNGAWWGGVFVSSPAYADGYVDGTGNNIYYGFKTDAKYAEAHFNIDVEYYDTFEHAKAGGTEGIDPLGKFVRVHYLSNCNNNATADDWRFRPMWWFGVPAGLKDPQDIQFKRIEKLTNGGKQSVKPAGSSQYVQTDANGYGAVSDKHFNSPKEWNNISNFYFSGENIASKGWKRLVGLSDKAGSKTYDNAGDTEKQWNIYKQDTQGLKGIFVDWESAGRRWYDMTYVSEMEDTAWKNRDKNPLRFAAGVYRFAGNWHYAVGQKHNTPKIADHFNLTYPAVTKVKDTKKLTGDEQEAVKNAIVDANKNAKYYSDLVDKVEVSEKGDATITFKDNTTRTMPASLLVTKDETDKDKYKPTLTTRTPVVNLKNLTSDEKTKIRQAIINDNGGSSPNEFLKHVKKNADSKQYEFNVKEDGSVEVTYEDDSKLTIPAEDLVFQGPKIADWAPYVVPDVIEVDDITKLTSEDITKIVNAFDEANKGITPYDEAKENNTGKKVPVTVDQTTGDATIKWKDGSTTTIAAWQFLKQKPKAPSPDPQPPAPTPAAEKEFIVEAPKTQLNVNFDPFNASQKDITDNQTQLNALKDAIKKCAAKDAKDNNTSVTIKDVEFKIVDGKGVVVFHAEGYKDATYPMSVFLKQKANTQTPQTPSTETKTETGQGEHDTFKYKVTKTQIDGDNPTAQDAVKALKQFVRDNYDNVSESDLASVGDSVAVSTNWTPKTGTKNMGAYGAQAPNDGPMMSFSIAGNDFGIKVHGRPWDPDAENGPDWNSSMDMDLFTIKPDELYVKKAGAQHQDNTLADLKKQAKDLLKQRRDTDHLTNNDLARAGVKDAENLNDGTIDNMDEKALRDLIRKLTDAKKAERKYNPIPEIEVTDPENLSEDDFKKAAEAFLKANYDGTDSLAVDKVPYTVPTSLKPKTDTVLMEPASDTNATGISSIKYTNSDFKKLIFSDKNNQQLFTVSVTYKKKAETPAPTPDALAQMKDDAKKIIDKNPYLTPDQKKEFKNKIDNAPDEKTIKQILKDANDKGKENKNNTTDPNVQQIINNNKGGGDEKKQHELDAAKEAAKKAIDALKNLSEQEKKDLKGKVDKANDINGVNSVVDESKKQNELNGVKKEAKEATFVFLDHGKGGKDDSSDPNHTEDAALNSVLDSTPEEDSTLKTLAEKLKEGSKATAEDIKNALAAAKRQNAINEENAKNAGIAKLDAKKADLVAAYNALTEDQKKSAKDKYEAATKAIDDAKDTVNNATKPSDIMTAVNGVDTSINDAKEDIKKNTPKRDTSQNTYDDQNALKQEKEKQIERIKNSDLPDADKQKAIDDINNAKKLGDPTGIADRALKAKKIADALDKLDKDFNHLNKAQKEAFKKIIEDTDAGDHTNADGTTSDDIDDALANAANTDNAMARLEDLKVIADEFATGDKYKALQDGNKQKKAFDDASTAAGAVLDRDKGDAKGAAEVNDIYADLLKAMQALDNTVKGAGVKTDALAAEIGSDKGLKPSETDPKTPGDSVYTTASADKKKAFDDALTAAEQALKTANDDNANYKKEGATPRTPEQEAKAQKAVDEALDKLIKARLALDGVNTKPLQDEIDKDGKVTSSVEYTNADKDKKKAYDEALQKAKDLIDKLTGKKDASADDHLDTKENKQKALDAALKVLSDAAAALDGKDTTPVPPSDDDNTGSGSESDSGSGTSTSTSGGVNKQNLINQINTTENPGGANPGSGAAGTNPSAPGAGAQGAGMGAVAPGSGAGAAGAGTAGAASAGVDNKAVNNAVENAPEVKQADAAVKQAAATLDEALAQAKRVAADPHATQAQVDAAAAKLADARKALADAQANAAKVRAAVRSRVIKGMRSRGNAGIATGANVATTGLMATMIAAIGGAFATRRMRTKHANRD
ncbi:GA module-containing protein [Gardnerella sp. DNF00257]